MTKIPTDQKAEVRFAPPRALIPWITAVQVWVYEKSGGRIGARAAGMPHLYSPRTNVMSPARRLTTL